MSRDIRALLAAVLWGSLSSAIQSIQLQTTPSDTTLALIAGRAKCGTSHIHKVLQSHPDVFSLRKELCPTNLEESEKNFADALQFTASQALKDGGLWQRLDAEMMTTKCVAKFGASWEKTCKGLYKDATSGGSERHTVVLQSCIQTEAVMHLQGIAPVPNARVLFLQRDPADLAWASYNFWQDGFDAEKTRGTNMGSWTQPGNYRSPDHFHELMLSRGKLEGSVRDWSMYVGIDAMERLRNSFGDGNVIFARSEDLPKSREIRRLTEFLGLNMDLIPAEVLSETTNSQDTLDDRESTNPEKDSESADSLANTNLTEHKPGEYQISGYRGLRCDTRKIIYEDSRATCKELADKFGLYYRECLGTQPVDC